MSGVVLHSQDAGLLGQYHVAATWDKNEGYHLIVYDRRESRDGLQEISKKWYPSKEKLVKAFELKVAKLRGARENKPRRIKNPTLLADQLDVFQGGHLATFLKPEERAFLKKIQAKLRADQPLSKGEIEFLGDAMSILMRQESVIAPEMIGPMAYAKMRANPRPPRERSEGVIYRIGRVNPRYNTFPVWFIGGEDQRPALFDIAFQNRPEVRVGNRIEYEFAVTGRGWRVVRADFQVGLSGPQQAQQAPSTSALYEFTTGYVTKLKGEEEGDQPYRMAWAPRDQNLAGTLQGISGVHFPEDVIDSYNSHRIQNGLPKILPSYGKVMVSGSQNGRVFMALRILDFQPEAQERSVAVLLSALDYQLNSVSFQQEGQRGYANINLPFDSHPTLNTLKQHFTGTVTFRGQFKKEGFWDAGGEHNYWLYLGNTAEWSDTSIDNLKRVIKSHRESEEVRRLIDEYYSRGGAIDMEDLASRLSGVLGRDVTVMDAARDFIPHTEEQRQEYEWDYIEAIKSLTDSVGGEYLYIPHRTEPEFVFTIGGFVVLEVPITNKASYIFRRRPGEAFSTLEQQLADIRAVPQRSAIYLDANIGAALGYVARVVHRTVSGWIDRVKAVVEGGASAEENPIIVPPEAEAEENPADKSADVTLARELALYAATDGTIYKQFIEPYVRNMAQKRVQQRFDRTRAIEGIANAAKWIQERYWREFSGTGPDHTPPPMNRATRQALAEELYGEIEGQIDDVTREILMGVRTRRGEERPERRGNPAKAENTLNWHRIWNQLDAKTGSGIMARREVLRRAGLSREDISKYQKHKFMALPEEVKLAIYGVSYNENPTVKVVDLTNAQPTLEGV
jgi:hypothetical protein